MMNERERLIKILKDNQGDSTYYMTDIAAQSVADYLLENGVVVLPCNLRLPDEMYRHMFDDNNTKIVVKCKVVKITGYGFTLRHTDGREWEYGYNRIGKTVFFTKEAEKALKDGDGK